MDKKTKKIVANGIICFGLIGLLFSLYLLFSSFGNNSLPASVDDQFQLMSQSMDDASVTAVHAAESIRSAKQSLLSAATVISQVGDITTTLASALNVNIMGFTPLISASQTVTDVQGAVDHLGNDITTTANHLDQNAADVQKLGEDFQVMSEQLKIVGPKMTGMIPGFNFTWLFLYF